MKSSLRAQIDDGSFYIFWTDEADEANTQIEAGDCNQGKREY